LEVLDRLVVLLLIETQFADHEPSAGADRIARRRRLLVVLERLGGLIEILLRPTAFVKRFGDIRRLRRLLDQLIEQGDAVFPLFQLRGGLAAVQPPERPHHLIQRLARHRLLERR